MFLGERKELVVLGVQATVRTAIFGSMMSFLGL
jgi:hypothetical protein